jgi:hypothetical protein
MVVVFKSGYGHAFLANSAAELVVFELGCEFESIHAWQKSAIKLSLCLKFPGKYAPLSTVMGPNPIDLEAWAFAACSPS